MVAFVAIAFHFFIAPRATSRVHKLLMLQHQERLRRERKILLQIALRNTRRTRRAWAWPRNRFWVESLLQGDFVEDLVEGKFQNIKAVGPDLSKRDTKLDRSLSRKSCK